jgi:hypothetical protein
MLWRGSLLPLEGAALPRILDALKNRGLDWGCFAAQREQAPSPQIKRFQHPEKVVYSSSLIGST